MTRIIAGSARGVRLLVPKQGTRPTSDRVREALYSALDSRDAISGAQVLDLYAGSGALGLEAASRGARSVTLVERHAGAAALCRKNAAAVGASLNRAPRVEVRAQSVRGFLEAALAAGPAGAAGTSREYDLVLIDPPYDLGEQELAGDLHAVSALISDEAIVVVERARRSPEPSWPEGLRPERMTRYGETVLWWAYPAAPSQPR